MNEWSLFEIEPTSDKRAIKRAYAKLIKTIDPAKEPQRFQKVREAYDYLLDYGRFYVEEESVELSENAATEEQDDEQLTQVEASKDYSQLSSQALTHTEPDVPQETESKKGDISVVDQLSLDEVILEEPVEDNFVEQKIALDSGQTQLVYSGIEFQSQELATDFQHKTSYQSANEFIEKLTKLFNSGSTVEKSDWINLIEDEEFQFFDVIELLRVDVFGFLVEQIEYNMEVGNQPEKLKLKLLKERLPHDFDWLVKYFAEHFDWKNTELILSTHFSGDQMKLVGQFYLKHNPVQVVDSTGNGSNTKHYIFWIIFLVVLVKVFSAMDESNVKEPISSEQGKVPSLFDSNKSSIFCSHYRLINSDKRALECEQKLLPTDSKKRLILALYWINQFDSDKKAGEPQEMLDKSLNKGVELLQEASDNQYNPATNLLAWMKLGKHYQQQDIDAAKALLKSSSANKDNVATIALSVGYYVGLWGEKNLEQANILLQSIDRNDATHSENTNYVVAAAYFLGVVKPQVGQNIKAMKEQMGYTFLENKENADLRLVNSVAWFYATTDDDSFSPNLALNLAKEFTVDRRNSNDWRHIDTLAAALAAKGHFKSAIQKIDLAQKLVEERYPETDDENRLNALNVLQDHRALFQKERRIQLKPDIQALQSVFSASFTELMRIDLQNLPE